MGSTYDSEVDSALAELASAAVETEERTRGEKEELEDERDFLSEDLADEKALRADMMQNLRRVANEIKQIADRRKLRRDMREILELMDMVCVLEQ